MLMRATTIVEQALTTAICEYPEYPWLDCNGDCLNDANEDGLCDEFEIYGCHRSMVHGITMSMRPQMTSVAYSRRYQAVRMLMRCSYDSGAGVDDGNCEYPEYPWLDCNGDCLNDANEDGLCDEFRNLRLHRSWCMELQ